MHLRNLYAHLLENHYIAPIVGFDATIMDIFSRDVLNKIQTGEPGWEHMVPEKAAAVIKERHLFGCKEAPATKLQASWIVGRHQGRDNFSWPSNSCMKPERSFILGL